MEKRLINLHQERVILNKHDFEYSVLLSGEPNS